MTGMGILYVLNLTELMSHSISAAQINCLAFKPLPIKDNQARLRLIFLFVCRPNRDGEEPGFIIILMFPWIPWNCGLFNSLRPRRNWRHFADDIFKYIFLYEKVRISLDFTEIWSYGSNQQYSNIGSDDGLVPTRRQAIIWTNDGTCYQRIYASLGLKELKGISNVRYVM